MRSISAPRSVASAINRSQAARLPAPLGDEEPLDAPPAPQRLQDRIAAIEQLAAGPRQDGRRPAAASAPSASLRGPEAAALPRHLIRRKTVHAATARLRSRPRRRFVGSRSTTAAPGIGGAVPPVGGFFRSRRDFDLSPSLRPGGSRRRIFNHDLQLAQLVSNQVGKRPLPALPQLLAHAQQQVDERRRIVPRPLPRRLPDRVPAPRPDRPGSCRAGSIASAAHPLPARG